MSVYPIGSQAEAEQLAKLDIVSLEAASLAATLRERNARINPQPVTRVTPTLGMFLGGVAFNTPEDFALRYQHFGEWLGRAPSIVIDFAGKNSWADADGSLALLNDAQNVCGVAKGVQFCLAYPLAVGNRVGALGFDDVTNGSLVSQLEHLCTALLSRDMANTIFRFGHEFNGDWYPWRAAANPAKYIAAYRYMVDFIRTRIPSAQFCWNFNIGKQQIAWGDVWPGRDYVDYVGVDCYDQYWGDPAVVDQAQRWDTAFNGAWGLRDAARFARFMGKPLCIPEWGTGLAGPVGGGTDNAVWVDYMADFITDPGNNVAWHAYWNRGAGSGYSGQIYPSDLRPLTAARFKERFGA